jgi:hypothetical protein
VLRIRGVCHGSRFLAILDTGSRIPDPTTATKERGEKVVVLHFLVATNTSKLKTILFFELVKEKNYFIFELVKKKICAK